MAQQSFSASVFISSCPMTAEASVTPRKSERTSSKVRTVHEFLAGMSQRFESSRLLAKTQSTRHHSGPKGKGNGGKGKKGASSPDGWPDGHENPPSDEKAIEKVAGLFVGAVSRHEKYSQRDWQAWERIQKQAREQWKSYKSANLCANAVDAELGERINLTIDSGCGACALPVCCICDRDAGVEQSPSRAHCCKRRENRGAWVQDSNTQISEWRRAEFKVQCYGKLAHTSGGSVLGCCSWQSDCAAAREPRWLVH